jgi:hypothetical protein
LERVEGDFLKLIKRDGIRNILPDLAVELKMPPPSELRNSIAEGVSMNYYEFIPWSRLWFVMLLEKLQRHGLQLSDHIVDVGSGSGEKLYLANLLGFTNLTGVELDKGLAKYSEENLGKCVNILNVNALSIQNWSGYKLIYQFKPIASYEYYLKHLNQVLDTMDVGSFFFEAYGSKFVYTNVLNKSSNYHPNAHIIIQKTGKGKFREIRVRFSDESLSGMFAEKV